MLLTILIGAPGSGKSTYASKTKDNNTVVLSSDGIRKILYGSEEDQTHNSEVFNTLYECMTNACDEKFDIIFDATNVTKKSRARAIKIAKLFDYKIKAVVFDISYAGCCERNSKRERKVPEKVIRKFITSFQFPTEEEGFDEIEVIK